MKIKHFLSSLFLIGTLTSTVQSSHAADLVAAENVVGSYLYALTLGDIESALSFLSSDFVLQRKTLLDNPAYAQQLKSAYTGATYEIVNSRDQADGRIRVAAKIVLPNNDTVVVQFTMQATDSSFIIAAEE